MEKLQHLKERICSFESLYAAYEDAAKEKHYREDVLDKFGLAVPTTTEEFYDVLVALKENNGGAAPLITS